MNHFKEPVRTECDNNQADFIRILNHHGSISNSLPSKKEFDKLLQDQFDTRETFDTTENHFKNRLRNCNGVSSLLHSGSSHKCPPNPDQMDGSIHFHSCNTSSQPEFAQTKFKDRERVFNVFTKFDSMRDQPLDGETRSLLRSILFNNWHYDESTMMYFLQYMFSELSLIQNFKIEATIIQKWLKKIYLSYHEVPFHNFEHCFCVTQMTYSLIHLMDLTTKMPPLDIFILLFSAICHDLDHPGYNNTFQVNAGTELSITYNDASPLENHHCSTAFRILRDDDVNILKNINPVDFKSVRKGVIRCILATDLAKHDDIMADFSKILNGFNYEDENHRNMLMMVIIKVADISNEMRSRECSSPWMERLFEEYFHQSDVEKASHLPVTEFMDRDKVNKPSAQANFIKIFLLPSLQSLASLEPKLNVQITAAEAILNRYLEDATNSTTL